MKIETLRWDEKTGWNKPIASGLRPDLVLYFGSTNVLERETSPWSQLKAAHPTALFLGCSTAGEISGELVHENGFSAALIQFAGTVVRGISREVDDTGESYAVGKAIGLELSDPELRHVLVLSDGLIVNGTTLTAGLRDGLPADVVATGGLAGDGARFQRTLVGLNAAPAPSRVAAVGFYGPNIRVKHGSAGGWEGFGPKRLITRSVGNVLYTLDDQPALALYKRYLGEQANGLPATGLLFPLQLLQDRESVEGVVRTILGVDEAAQSLTFAGDLPVGRYARLMRASCDDLVSGADEAAQQAHDPTASGSQLAVLVSCVGRKLVMGQRVDEEVEAVLSRFARDVHGIGFYSYGEICPSAVVAGCDLHNQTMTMAIFSEVD